MANTGALASAIPPQISHKVESLINQPIQSADEFRHLIKSLRSLGLTDSQAGYFSFLTLFRKMPHAQDFDSWLESALIVADNTGTEELFEHLRKTRRRPNARIHLLAAEQKVSDVSHTLEISLTSGVQRVGV